MTFDLILLACLISSASASSACSVLWLVTSASLPPYSLFIGPFQFDVVIMARFFTTDGGSLSHARLKT